MLNKNLHCITLLFIFVYYLTFKYNVKMYHETSAALTTAKWEADKTRGQLQGKEREKWDEWYERIENLRNEIQEYCNQKDENERKNDGNERKE